MRNQYDPASARRPISPGLRFLVPRLMWWTGPAPIEFLLNHRFIHKSRTNLSQAAKIENMEFNYSRESKAPFSMNCLDFMHARCRP